MKRLLQLTIAMALLGAASMLAAQSFDRGRALYENHCQRCHESWVHARDGRRVASLQALRQRVTGWSVHSGLDWSEDEIGDVVDYLNVRFYQLTR